MGKPGSAGLTSDKLGDSDMWVAKEPSDSMLSDKIGGHIPKDEVLTS